MGITFENELRQFLMIRRYNEIEERQSYKRHKNVFVQSFLGLVFFLFVAINTTNAQVDTSFWFAQPDVWRRSTSLEVRYLISTYSQPATVVIEQPANNAFTPVTINIPADSFYSFNVENIISSVVSAPDNEILNRGFHIHSSAPISCYYETTGDNGEIYVLKGMNALGNSFLVPMQTQFPNHSGFGRKSSIEIIASQDSTLVTVISPVALTGGIAGGTPITFTLNRGQSYCVRANGYSNTQHLYNTTIHSSKPIAVNSTDDLVSISGADLAGDQILPIRHLGRRYLALRSNSVAAYLSIFPLENNTHVTINGSEQNVINRNGFISYQIPSSVLWCLIESDNPIAVFQLDSYGGEAGGTMLPHADCTGSTETVYLRPNSSINSTITLFTTTPNISSFSLNNDPTFLSPSDFNPVPGSPDLSYCIKDISPFVPIGTPLKLHNSTGPFHLSVIDQTNIFAQGLTYSYFSDYAPSSYILFTMDTTYFEGDTIIFNYEAPNIDNIIMRGPMGSVNMSTPYAIEGATSVNSGVYYIEGIDTASCLSNVIDSIIISVRPRPLCAREGTLHAAFSVGEGRQVYFSQGNLQYQASTGTWRFAENQYDCIRDGNSNISSSYEGWIDLFGWGTSGWSSGATAYQPYSTSQINSQYYPGGNYTNDLTGDYAEADWAWHNPVSNGGNQTHLWRTLTAAEWQYLLEGRGDALLKRGAAKVGVENGIVILPDNWTLPDGLSFNPSFDGWYTNFYNLSQWQQMEAAGALFLPAAGYRNGTTVNTTRVAGEYWTTTHLNANQARLELVAFAGTSSPDEVGGNRYMGAAVRPVQNIPSTSINACDSFSWNNHTYTASGTYYDTLTSVRGCDSVATLILTILPVCDTNCNSDTIAVGSSTSSYIPIYAAAGNNLQRSQTIYPAEMLTDLVGKRIDSLHYFVSSGSWSGGDWTISMGVTRWQALQFTFDNVTTLTPVYHGSLTADATEGMGIHLDTSFPYAEGNLIVQFVQNNASGNSSCSFYGTLDSPASRSGNVSSGNIMTIGGSASSFIPKIAFHACNDSTIDTSLSLRKVALPYCENFDNYPAGEGNMPLYWGGYNTLAMDMGRYPLVSSEYSVSPNNSFGFHLMGNNLCYAILPDFAIDSIQQLNLSFKYRNKPTEQGMLVIGVLPDTNNINSFLPIDTLYPPSDRWEQVNYSFNNYHGTTQRVAFLDKVLSGYSFANIYIDDFIASSWVSPVIETLGSHGTRAVLPDAEVPDYWLEYGPHGFSPGYDSSAIVHVIENPYYIMGLAEGTDYDFYAYPTLDSNITVRGTCNNPLPIHQLDCNRFFDTIVTVCDTFFWFGTPLTLPGNYTDTLITSLGCDSVITLHLTLSNFSTLEGTIASPFSVSENHTVYFSQGNLQYQASNNIWRFAEHQYDYVGSTNSNISSNYNGWIDLFGWGTSGWNSGAEAYLPYATNQNNNHYYPGGLPVNDLTNNYVEADWAYHNAIYNGGNVPHIWRTMTSSEWQYLLNTRTTITNLGVNDARFVMAKVNNINGVILFPNTYYHPTVINIPSYINYSGNDGWNVNSFDVSEWEMMENAGAVFLPACGSRNGTWFFYSNNEGGGYWSSTHYNGNFVLGIAFYGQSIVPDLVLNRHAGYSVRPVQDIVLNNSDTTITACESYIWNNHTYTTSGDYYDTLTNSSGCDSIVALHLTIAHTSTRNDTVTDCDNYTWIDGNTYTESTDGVLYTFVNANADGCDSVITLHLTINYKTTGDTITTACNYYNWSNQLLVVSGEYTDTLTNTAGCDSVVTMHLTINYGDSVALNISACDSYTWDVDGNTYISDTTLSASLLTQAGCDSLITLHVTILPSPVLQHIPDTVIDDGGSLTLHAHGADMFTWRDEGGTLLCNDSVFAVSPNTSTVYYLTAFNQGNNLVYNGDFELGNTGFTTAYTYSTNLNPAGYYCVGPNAHNYHYGFTGAHDHTSGSGNYMIVNGSGNAGTNLWTQTVTVQPYTDYAFSVWGTNVSPYSQPYMAMLQFSINGSQIGDIFQLPTQMNTWTQFYEVWNSGPNTSATITILNMNTLLGGNDFGIDDISFSSLTTCQSYDTVRVFVGQHVDSIVCDNQFPFLWNGGLFLAPGAKTATLTGHLGQDSIVIMNVVAAPTRNNELAVTTCDSFVWNADTYTTTGDYLDTLTTTMGCDSVVTMHLTVNHSTTSDTTAVVCDGFTWWHTDYTDNTDSATHRFTNASGCDSVVTLHLTVNYSNTGTETVTACNRFVWHGTEYTTSTDTPTYTTLNAVGCDSVTTLHLTVNHCTATTVTTCDSYTWLGNIYTTSGTYIDGNDTLYLTVNQSTASDTMATVCDSYTWIDGNTYTASTTTDYTLSTTNSQGCDSVVTLHLTVNPSDTSDTTVVACDHYSWHGTDYTVSATPTLTFTNASGCDSVVTLNLTINYSNTGDASVTACDSYFWSGQWVVGSGQYTDTLTNAAGCDSTVTLNLAINHSNTATETITACDSYNWHGTEYTTSNSIATHTETNTAGCDSVTTLDLTVNYSSTGTETVTACNSFVWHGTLYTASTNSPTYTSTNAAGCDSITTLSLTVNYCSSTDITACDTFSWHGTQYTTSGQYYDGSDTLNLTIHHSTDSVLTLLAFANELPVMVNGTTYPTFGHYQQVFTNAAGCDSVFNIHIVPYPDNIDSAECIAEAVNSPWSIELKWSTAEVVSPLVIPFVGDIDSDAVPEVICFASNNSYGFYGVNRVLVYDTRTQQPIHQIDLPGVVSTVDGAPYGMVRLPNGHVVFVVVMQNGTMSAYDLTARATIPLWSTSVDLTAPNIGFSDFNADGQPEVYVGNKIYNAVTGALIANNNDITNLGAAFCVNPTTVSPMAYDMTGDGKPELVLGNEIYSVNITNTNDTVGNSLTLVNSTTPPTGITTDGHAQAADFNLDGYVDLLISTKPSRNDNVGVYLWDVHNGEVSNPLIITANTWGKSVPLIADIDNDGQPEFVIQCGASSGGRVRAYKYNIPSKNFSLLWSMNVDEDSWSNSMSAFDFNNDGMTDLVISDQSSIKIVNGSGKSHLTGNDTLAVYVLSSLLFGECTVMQYPVIADVDDDGSAEIVACGRFGSGHTYRGSLNIFHSATASWAPARKVWNQYMYNVTNINEDLTIPQYQFNNATVFVDTMGVERRPYNNFLQQATSIDRYGHAFVAVPDAVASSATAAIEGNNFTISLDVSNAGDNTLNAPYGITVYKNAYRGEVLHIETVSQALPQSSNQTITITLPRATICTFANVDSLVIALNDTSTGIAQHGGQQMECDTSNNTVTVAVPHNSTSTDTHIACDSYTWIDGITYMTDNNAATYTLFNAAGCDSITTLNLTINESSSSIEVVTACNSFVWHGTEYTASTTTPTFTSTNIVGCDSIATLHLTINPCSTADITACDTFSWHGTLYTTSGQYYDGTDTLNLTINHSNTGDTIANACDLFTWWHTDYTNNTDDATHTFTNAAGCDSVVTLHLTIRQSTASSEVQTVCDNYNWFNGETLTATGTYFDTITNASGCDSVVSLQLTVNHSNTGTDIQTACDSMQWIDGNTYTSSNFNSQFSIFNSVGCDSVVTLHLTINHSSDYTDTHSVCDSYTWIDGNTYTASNSDASYTLTNTEGCDSVVTLHLTLRHSTGSTVHDTVVENSLPHSFNGLSLTDSVSNLAVTLTNAAGCDSVIDYSLYVHWNAVTILDSSLCNDGLPITWNGIGFDTLVTHTATMTRQLMLTTQGGADSTVVMRLTVHPIYDEHLYDTLYEGDTYPFEGTLYDTTGIYPHLLQTVAGCDSLRTLHLQYNRRTYLDSALCSNQLPLLWNGLTFTEQGVDSLHLSATDGRDSLVVMRLNVLDTSSYTAVVHACDSLVWIDGNTYTQSNFSSRFTIPNSVGCDSVVTLQLTIDSSHYFTDHQEICDSIQWINGEWYSEDTAGVTAIIPTVAGCDSVVTLELVTGLTVTSELYDTMCYNDTYSWHNLTVSGTAPYQMELFALADTLRTVDGCDSVVTMHLTKIAQPRIHFVDTTKICSLGQYSILAEATAPLTLGGEPQPLPYLVWSSSPTDSLLDGHENGNPLYVSPQAATAYTLFADYSETYTCPTRSSITLLPLTYPEVELKVIPEALSYNHLDFTAIDITKHEYKHRIWYIDGQRQVETGRSITDRASFDADSVIVTLELYDSITANSCSGTAVRVIPVNRIALYAPNIFTPTRDDNNHFDIITQGVISGELYIYNREGLLVYYTPDYTTGWDGHTTDGTLCIQSAYVWKLIYRAIDSPGSNQIEVGTVTLIR